MKVERRDSNKKSVYSVGDEVDEEGEGAVVESSSSELASDSLRSSSIYSSKYTGESVNQRDSA